MILIELPEGGRISSRNAFIWASAKTPQFRSIKSNPFDQKLLISQSKTIHGLKIILVAEFFCLQKSYSEFQTAQQIRLRLLKNKFTL